MNSDKIKSFIKQNFPALCSDPGLFDELALEVFLLQKEANPLYKKYLQLSGLEAVKPSHAGDIPALPIQLFKSYDIRTGTWEPAEKFLSSGTTGMEQSRHLVRDPDWYKWVSRHLFEYSYGSISEACFLALLPSYLERKGSSLIAMMDDFISLSDFPQSGFFLHDTVALLDKLRECREADIPVFLFGVSFALWDLAEQFPADFSGVRVMETGGMKGRRREITRQELHEILQHAWNVDAIHSEYGMTELFSQAYSSTKGIFKAGPTLRVYSRDVTDPLATTGFNRTAALNLVDLANIDTICFIASEDLGKCYADGSFEVLGRLDNSDIRGCNLLLG